MDYFLFFFVLRLWRHKYSPGCKYMRHMHSHREYSLQNIIVYWHQESANAATVSIQTEGAKVRIHIRKSANTYFKNNSSNILPVFARVRIQVSHVFAQK